MQIRQIGQIRPIGPLRVSAISLGCMGMTPVYAGGMRSVGL